jgi:hypothetical protein
MDEKTLLLIALASLMCNVATVGAVALMTKMHRLALAFVGGAAFVLATMLKIGMS